MAEKRSGECEYCGHLRYTNDLFNGACVPCVLWAEDQINALTAEVVALKAKRICACGATVEELVIGEVTYRTNASSTNAKLMAEVSRLQAELAKPEPMVPLRLVEEIAIAFQAAPRGGHDEMSRWYWSIDAALRAAREGER